MAQRETCQVRVEKDSGNQWETQGGSDPGSKPSEAGTSDPERDDVENVIKLGRRKRLNCAPRAVLEEVTLKMKRTRGS